MLKKFLLSALAVATIAVTFSFSLAASTSAEENDVYRYRLYRDGSVSCSGADNTSKGGGQVVLFPTVGAVHFKVKLRNAQPNTAYTMAISEEPTCANPQFYTTPVTTDGDGDATFYGTYNTTSGPHNLLVNVFTSSPVTNPINREIATQNAHVVVP